MNNNYEIDDNINSSDDNEKINNYYSSDDDDEVIHYVKTRVLKNGTRQEYDFRRKRTPLGIRQKIWKEFIHDILEENEEKFNGLTRKKIGDIIMEEFKKEGVNDVKLNFIMNNIKNYQKLMNEKFN